MPIQSDAGNLQILPQRTRFGLDQGGTAAEDVPSVIWMFRYVRGLPYLETAIDHRKAGGLI